MYLFIYLCFDHLGEQLNYNVPEPELLLFRMGLFGAAHRWAEAKKVSPLPEICHTYPKKMKLGTVIPYLKKTPKIYESRNTHPIEFC